MFKVTTILFVIMLLNIDLHAQEGASRKNLYTQKKNNFVRTEGGYAFTGSGDISGYTLNAEVGRELINRLKAAIGAGYMKFSGNRNLDIIQDATAISTDLHVYVDIFDDEEFDIEVGGGGFYRNWHRAYTTAPTTGLTVKGIQVPPGSYAEINYNAVGYSASVGVKAKIASNLKLSVRGLYQNDSQGDNALAARGGLIFIF